MVISKPPLDEMLIISTNILIKKYLKYRVYRWILTSSHLALQLQFQLFFTQFSHNDTAHDQERPKKLKDRDISSQDELVDEGCHNSSEAAENDPDGWWHQDQACQVDVVVDCVDH